ncbi:hypothetical protein FACS189472_13620 [Alphaproteobacteria bacterium]|nr:hypothetical protein FACS189472_13620 [Alphaproteobacteria bacterium]
MEAAGTPEGNKEVYGRAGDEVEMEDAKSEGGVGEPNEPVSLQIVMQRVST